MEEVQKVDSKNPVLTVETIQDSKNPDFSTLRLRWKVQEGNGSNFLGQFLGNLESKGRIGFQTMRKDILAEMGVKEGDNLNDKLPVKGRITVTEISHSDYLNLEDSIRKGFTPKINPQTKMFLVNDDGEYIYRNSKLTPVNESDVFINHVGSVQEAPEPVEETVTEDELPA